MGVPRGIDPSRPRPGLLATLEVLPFQARIATGVLMLGMGVLAVALSTSYFSLVLLGAGVLLGLPLVIGGLGDRRRAIHAVAELARAQAELAQLRSLVEGAHADRRSVGALLRERGYTTLSVQRWIARESRTFNVVRNSETTSYREGADSTASYMLFGAADEEEIVSRIDPQACYGCHNSLQFHGGSRRSVEACLSCHGAAGTENTLLYENPTSGNPFGTSAEFRFLLHNLHNGVFPGMTGGVQDCAKCHGTNTAWKLPDERLHPDQAVPTRAWRAACSSCHSDSPAVAHIDANTSPSGAEACAVCHGLDDDLNVTQVHKFR